MAILNDIELTNSRSQWPLPRILGVLGLNRSVYYAWKRRAEGDALADKSTGRESVFKILPEEEQAIVDYALAHPADGYRRLCWLLVDEDVACVSPGTVYNVLNKHDLLYRWKRSQSSGKPPAKPTSPNQRWHTDIMYLWLAGRWYFFVGVIDGYSRYLVHWELLTTMKAEDITLVVQRALEKYPSAKPEIVHDNGSQFTSKEFKKLIQRFKLAQIRIRLHHPESNGTIERFHRSLREEMSDKNLPDLGQARVMIGQWVDYYNHQRLHAGIRYLRPADYHFGYPEQLIEIRKDKLRKAQIHRKLENQRRLNEINRSKQIPEKSPICA
jgi:putative transposase